MNVIRNRNSRGADHRAQGVRRSARLLSRDLPGRSLRGARHSRARSCRTTCRVPPTACCAACICRIPKTQGKLVTRAARPRARCRGRRPRRQPDLRAACRGRVERGEPPPVLGAARLRPWLRGAVGDGGFLLQVRRALQPADEIVVRWNDPALGIDWGIDVADRCRPAMPRRRCSPTMRRPARPTGRSDADPADRRHRAGRRRAASRRLQRGTASRGRRGPQPCSISRNRSAIAGRARPHRAGPDRQSGRLYGGRSRRGRARTRVSGSTPRRPAPSRAGRPHAACRSSISRPITCSTAPASGHGARTIRPGRCRSMARASSPARMRSARPAGRISSSAPRGSMPRTARISCAPSRGSRGERKELRIVADQFGAPTSARVIADAVAGIVATGRRAARASALPPRTASSTWRQRARRAGMDLPWPSSKA